MGNATKAKNELKWEPKITFNELVEEMVENDELLAKSQLESISFNGQADSPTSIGDYKRLYIRRFARNKLIDL